MAEKTKKSHRERKNPHAAEQFAEQRKARNAARGKQVWVPEIDIVRIGEAEDIAIPDGGHWERIST
ncbi:MAG TPA: hypothetical protein VMH89_10540 [Candidatus Acidoferrum sp.]|nr:hypothetical protein [Candidatus Acidoferrum sp.]